MCPLLSRRLISSAWIGLLLVLLSPTPARAQVPPADPELGRPVIRNWTMRDYGAFPQNWTARRGPDGRMYFGNRDGVLVYDGQSWRTLPHPGQFTRGLAFGRDGRLYVGGIDTFGYFERTGLGEWGPFTSLVEQMPEQQRKFADIWDMFATGDGIFFATEHQVFRWDGSRFHVWNFPTHSRVRLFNYGDDIYTHLVGEPVKRLVRDTLEVAFDLPGRAEARLTGILETEPEEYLISWMRDGISVLRGGSEYPWAPDWHPYFKTRLINGLHRIGPDRVAVRTVRDGVLIFTVSGKFLQRIDLEAGLYNGIVRDLTQDAEGGLWLALNHGVAYVDALTAYSNFDSQNGLGRSTVLSIARDGETLYVSSAEGLFRLVPGTEQRMARFEFLPEVEGPLYAVTAHHSGLLLAVRDSVLFLPHGSKTPVRVTEDLVQMFLQRPNDPDTFWLATSKGVRPLTYHHGQWTAGPRLDGPEIETRTLAELPDGSVWATTVSRGLMRWPSPLAPAEIVFQSRGLPEKHGWMRLVRWGDRLVASTQRGLYLWDVAAEEFKPFPVVGRSPDEQSMNLFGGDPNHLWTFYGPDRRRGKIMRVSPSGHYEALPQAIVQGLGDIETMYRESRDGREVLWIGGSFGLTRVVVSDGFPAPAEFTTLIGQIERQYEPRRWDNGFAWEHRHADLRFQFAATTYRSGRQLQFQHWLEGYDSAWSDWAGDATRGFTNLSAGRYTFHVRARNADGQLGQTASFAFTVLPPWWQTPWAAVGAVIVLLLGVFGLVRWRVRVSERERERLQVLVAERTCQLAESERNLLHAKEAAEAANRAKSAFLASMSHELRTPLNAVLGYAQILRRSSEVGPSAQRALTTIQRSGDHLLHLINEVLDLAKVEAGRIELQPTPFPLERFVQSISDLFAARAAEKRLRFDTPDPRVVATLVSGDEPRLRQVLLNLLGNAFKFTERGGVSWTLSSPAPDRWRIEVSDTGVGIAPEEQRRIFEPFYQSKDRPGLAQQGTGLGLSISAHLVELMGGRLHVESQPGVETRFWFEVSLPTVTTPEPAFDGETESRRLMVGYHGRRRRVLVVDDEKNNRALLLELLSPLGFILEEADGAATARAAVARQAPDIVLLDLRMPGQDGFTLAREWKTSGVLLGAKILALSASVLPEQQSEALAAGCDAFLAKPFREDQLLRVIGSLIDLEWIENEAPAPERPDASATPSAVDEPVRWEAGLLQRLLQLAEHGDALRLSEELAMLARRGTGWAKAVAPWQKLALGFQMEAISRALQDTLRTATPSSSS